MKIVHVITALTKGGAERVVVDLANRADAEGHEVTILTAVPAAASQMPGPLRPGVDVRHILGGQRPRKMVYPLIVPWMLRNREWLFAQDVVHCHLTFGSVFGAVMQGLRGLARRGSPAVVETYHAVGMAISPRRRAIHAALLSERDAVAFMADDPFWAKFAKGRSDTPVRIIPNGIAPPPLIDQHASERYREKASVPKNALVVGSIGRLLHERRPDLLLQVFASIVERFDGEVHFLLGGEGPERRNLEQDARRIGIADRVHLPGIVLKPAEPLGITDLYLTVNVGPTTGIAAMEAAFAGVPIMAVQLQASYRAKAGDWIWSSSDPVALADRAAALLSDRDALHALALNQQAYALAHHSVEAMAESYDRLYEEALAQRGRFE